ncbi:tRNA (adenosine(37)-N6)-threonylcarbamoyltransferase complex dimerization subunit type 1 TsaB [Geomobilimonas luticola]|uniref:tRNA (Adenosine(37)-N6)-threonylcarbamoyltransferase complex dimerization subunit type 1 TsaB n=1 Tax=Geomobilimonas luticola TaxID=1114878 RepID=A0ABS5SHW1_9BACT|nr:tRNA (adenosine(37)-N6)-threonylcarbamoyltransferase complex dimerization subunit type 1 TsaB [Geomobilimonas luticola]MBT0654256.1 tRNA (adenosine(37)-N6)-threonylcarbamoyltransferase complex dimerization subunit type 1 TsaB [Geomobilimonas luticola]
MKLLAIDTSTNTCSVALSCDGRLVGEYLLEMQRTLSERLLDGVELLLTGAGLTVQDMDGFGVALGPGSFTGLRIGIATVKGLALATGKPVAGFSSLAMLAMNLPWADAPVCPMFDARKKEVYTGLYRCRELPEPVISDCVLSPEAFLEQLDGPVIFVGDGAVRYRERIESRLGARARFAPASVTQPRAAAGALLAEAEFAHGASVTAAALAPLYIRPSEAELARLQRETP